MELTLALAPSMETTMKHALLLLAAVLATVAVTATVGKAQPPQPHRVVFELTSDEPKEWESLLNNVENARKALGATTLIEVVAHGPGLTMLVATKSAAVRDRVKENADRGVVFAACSNTMHKHGVKPNELHKFANTVDSGVAEVVRKQAAGWAYVRSGG